MKKQATAPLQVDGITVHACTFKYPTQTSTKKRWYIDITCEKCGKPTNKVYSKGTWNLLCGYCSRGRRTPAEFISAAIQVHGSTYDYTNTVYNGKLEKVSIVCKLHGEFYQRASDHLNGAGCTKCGTAATVAQLTVSKEAWAERIDTDYITLLSKTSNTYGVVKCNIHNIEFDAVLRTAADDTRNACPICRRVRHRKQPVISKFIGSTTTLYFVYIEDIDMYKLGVTTQRLVDRLAGLQFKIIWTESLDYLEGLDLEHAIHTANTRLRYKGLKRLISEGTYECYHSNVFKTFQDAYRTIKEI